MGYADRHRAIDDHCWLAYFEVRVDGKAVTAALWKRPRPGSEPESTLAHSPAGIRYVRAVV